MRLAIDPGVSSGWALFRSNGELRSCGASADGCKAAGPFFDIEGAIIERPQVYRAALSKGDPNDLITLAIQVGRYTERLESAGVPVAHVLPNEWKGQIPKDIHHSRIFGALSYAAQAIVADAGKGLGVKARGDMMDAVGLGLWAFSRGKWPV